MIINYNHNSCTISIIKNYKMIATASSDLIQPELRRHWLNRVFVNEGSRGQGLGTIVLSALKVKLRDEGVRGLVVCPGGYGSDPQRQRNFYEKNGFVRCEDILGRYYLFLI